MGGYPILNIPTGELGAGAAEADIVVTSFNQSLGAELVTNGDMSTLWGASGTPTTRELVAGRLHIVTDAANEGAASSAYSHTAGLWYQMGAEYEVISGNLHIFLSNTNPKFQFQYVTGSHARQALQLETNTTFRAVTAQSGNAGASEFYLDNASEKAITLNTQQTGWADAISQLFYTLPASPKSLQTIALLFRIQDTSNFWIARVQRNLANSAWDFLLDDVATNSFTNEVTDAGIGDTDGIRVTTSGTSILVDTRASGVWTNRANQTNALYQAEAGTNVVYSEDFPPTKLLIDRN